MLLLYIFLIVLLYPHLHFISSFLPISLCVCLRSIFLSLKNFFYSISFLRSLPGMNSLSCTLLKGSLFHFYFLRNIIRFHCIHFKSYSFAHSVIHLFLAVPGLSRGTRASLSCGTRALWLRPLGSAVVVCRPRFPEACGSPDP